jgi:small subunit ribosomal protein S18
LERRTAKKTPYSRRGAGKDFRDKDLLTREIRKKVCRFCQDKVEAIDYKDITRLSKFVTDRKKILSRRISGNCAKHQRKISRAIKRARFLALV